MLFRTARLLARSRSLSEPEARGPEDHDAPLEWRAPSGYPLASQEELTMAAPLTIRLHPADNVVVARMDILPGTKVEGEVGRASCRERV